ncbi:ParB N-terminal domain-containing protein [Pseudomonas fluorescens]|uniref:ParB/RepB/Spo0J family partition protein n=1 Tax=Pseudomonas fluorescens TaxID=294 RepID=UPI001CD65FFC
MELSGSRPTIPDTVNAMSQSLRALGLINPITVRPTKVYDGAIYVPGYQVVAGNHRVVAARALGWTEIEAFEIPDDDRLDHELREIDENLCRAELSPSQRSYAIKRRKEIWEMRNQTGGTNCSTSLPDGRKAGQQHEKQFAADTASATGQSKQDINRHIARAEALGDDLLEVAGTSLDKGVELDALKSMPEPKRKELIQRAKAGEQVSARAKPEQKDLSDRLMEALEAVAELAAAQGMKPGEFSKLFANDAELHVTKKALDGIEVAQALRGILMRADRAKVA